MAGLLDRLHNRGGKYKPNTDNIQVDDPVLMKDILAKECESDLLLIVDSDATQPMQDSAEMDVRPAQDTEIPMQVSETSRSITVVLGPSDSAVIQKRGILQKKSAPVPVYREQTIETILADRLKTHDMHIFATTTTYVGHCVETARGIKHYVPAISSEQR